MKVIGRAQSRDSFNVMEREKVVPGDLCPTFITAAQRKVPTNSELLQTYYIDCFGRDNDIRSFDSNFPDLPEEMYNDFFPIF